MENEQFVPMPDMKMEPLVPKHFFKEMLAALQRISDQIAAVAEKIPALTIEETVEPIRPEPFVAFPHHDPLFRAKSLGGYWMYGWYIGGDLQQIVSFAGNSPHAVDPETACQFTGILDKNGNRIFAGDIVKTPEITGVVEYDETIGAFLLVDARNTGVTFFDMQFDKKTAEVIGNIFDTPDFESLLSARS